MGEEHKVTEGNHIKKSGITVTVMGNNSPSWGIFLKDKQGTTLGWSVTYLYSSGCVVCDFLCEFRRIGTFLANYLGGRDKWLMGKRES